MDLGPDALLWAAYAATAVFVIAAGVATIVIVRTGSWAVVVVTGPTLAVTAAVGLPTVWEGAVEVAAQHAAQEHAVHVAELIRVSWGRFPDAEAREHAETILSRRTTPLTEPSGATSWYLPTEVHLERWWADDETLEACVFVQTPADPDDLTMQLRWCAPSPDGTPYTLFDQEL